MVTRLVYIIILIPLSLCSCITLKYYDAEILIPAQVDFTQQKNTASVILSEKYNEQDTNAIMTPNQKMTLNAMISFRQIVEESPKFELIDFPAKMNPRDYLKKVNDTTDHSDIPDFVFESSGVWIDTILTQEFRGTVNYRILTNAYWNIYDLTKKVYYPIEYPDTVNAEFPSSTGIPQSQMEELYEFIGNRSGFRIAEYFCPTWQDVGRMYFSSQQYFIDADQFVDAGEFLKAAETWRLMTDHRSDRIASRACYNMALAAEMNGDLDLALSWLEQAEKKGLDNYAAYFREIIRSRQIINKQLDKQMGVVKNQ